MSRPEKARDMPAAVQLKGVEDKFEAAMGPGRSRQAIPGLTALIGTPLEEQLRIWEALNRECQEGIIVCDASQRIVFVNPAFESITGYSAAQAIGRTPAILHSGQQDKAFYTRMWTAVRNTKHWRGEICNRRRDGRLYDQWLSLSAITDQAGAVTHYIGVFSDLTQRKRAEDRMRQLVSFDLLTRLPNRRLLTSRMEKILQAASSTESKAALLFIDLDRFKNINDSIGHEAGDLMLRTMGSRLRSLVRRSDVVARIGGDEFALLLVNVGSRADVNEMAIKMLAEVATPLRLGNREVEISGSIGICIFPDDAATAGEMIRNAETAMYRAKNLGRNTFQFYSPDMGQYAQETMDTETALRQALKQQQFELYYQPQVDLCSGQICSVEALIRWNRPDFGLILPSHFIPLAEDRGLITEVGKWTLAAACRQIAAWESTGLSGFTVAINLSVTQFHRDRLVERVEQTLREAAIAPGRLELEITEGIIVQDTESTLSILQQLHELGVRLSIDDFGTGYSSLSYLRKFPVDQIKIDRSFVSEMTEDASTAGIVRGIIELAHGLGMEVTAEGMETDAQLRHLKALKCDRAQGYLISKPLSATEFARFMHEWPGVRDRYFAIAGKG